LAQAAGDDYSSVEAHDKRNHAVYGKALEKIHPRRLEEVVRYLDWVFSIRWAIIQHNPRKIAIYDIRDAFVCNLVNVDSEKRVRVNTTAKKSEIEKVDRLAQQAGMTRSAYFSIIVEP
jgi:hypothetical protein